MACVIVISYSVEKPKRNQSVKQRNVLAFRVGVPLCVGPLRRLWWTELLLLGGIAVEVARPDGETLAVQDEVRGIPFA